LTGVKLQHKSVSCMNLLPGTNSIVSRVYPQLFVLQTHLSVIYLHGRRAASGEFPWRVYTCISSSALPVPAKPLQNTPSVISGVRACSANHSAPTGNCVYTLIIGNVLPKWHMLGFLFHFIGCATHHSFSVTFLQSACPCHPGNPAHQVLEKEKVSSDLLH
jgi:hypothetical protein